MTTTATPITTTHPGDILELPAFASPEALAEAIGIPVEGWYHECHGTSLAIVRAGIIPGGARVARGHTIGIGVHSWVVAGPDCYAPDATIVDVVAATYIAAPWLVAGTMADMRRVYDGPDGPTMGQAYMPHLGYSDIWEYGRPSPPTGPIIELAVQPTSSNAIDFLRLLGPLDRQGWSTLCNGPLRGWPAQHIIPCIAATEDIAQCLPVDSIGMATHLNPGDLYLGHDGPGAPPVDRAYIGHCLEEDRFFDADDLEDGECPSCVGKGEDPWRTEVLIVEPCPLPFEASDRCLSEWHHHGRGDHLVDPR